MVRKLLVRTPAKVNLHLAVGSLRADGFHVLEGIFHAVALYDELHVSESPEFGFECDCDLGVDSDDNLVVRAVRSMESRFERAAGVSIALSKHIPSGAGLGGGSSDAAATIAALAHLWGVDRIDPRCVEVASSIGSDVPFFLYGGAALMTGRGEVLSERLPATRAPIVLVKPAASVATSLAYRMFDESPIRATESDLMRKALQRGDIREIAARLYNNLEGASISLVPEIGAILDRLCAVSGSLGVAMSGSGSAVFAVCENESVAREIARSERAAGNWTCHTALVPSGIEIREEEIA